MGARTTKMSLKKIVVFDWSGTLSDDRKPVYEANKVLFQSYGKEIQPYHEWEDSRCGNAAEYAKMRGIEDEPKEIQKRFTQCFKDITEKGIKPTPYKGIHDVLKILKKEGSVLFLVSSHPHEILVDEVKTYGVFDHFHDVQGSIFDKSVAIQSLIKKFSFENAQVVYVGDTIQDVRAAKKAGVKMFAVTEGYHSQEQLLKEDPDWIYPNVTHIPSLLDKIFSK